MRSIPVVFWCLSRDLLPPHPSHCRHPLPPPHGPTLLHLPLLLSSLSCNHEEERKIQTLTECCVGSPLGLSRSSFLSSKTVLWVGEQVLYAKNMPTVLIEHGRASASPAADRSTLALTRSAASTVSDNFIGGAARTEQE